MIHLNPNSENADSSVTSLTKLVATHLTRSRHEDEEDFSTTLWWWWGKSLIVMGILLLIFLLRQVRELYGQMQRKKLPPVASIPFVVPNPHWLFGHLLALRGGSSWVACQENVFRNHAGGNVAFVSSFWWSHRPAFSALHADAVQHILRRTHDRIAVAAVRRHHAKLLGDNTLVFARGKEWRHHRSMVHGAFVDEALQHAQRTMLQMSLRVEQAMVNTSVLQSKPQAEPLSNQPACGWHVEAYQLCKMATLDAFGMAALGYDFGCSSTGIMTSQHSAIFRQTEFFQQELTQRCFEERWNVLAQYYWIPTPRNIRHALKLRTYKKALLHIVKARRAELENQKGRQKGQNLNQLPMPPLLQEHAESKSLCSIPNDEGNTIDDDKNSSSSTPENNVKNGNSVDGNYLTILDFLLRGSDKEGAKPLSDQYIAEFLSSIVFGGYDSTALALSYTMYLLATHPEHQDRCAKEAINVLGESCTGNNTKSLDSFLAITNLPYCYAALLESLRYYPPVAFSSRDLTKPMSLDIDVEHDTGKRTVAEIPAGVRFIISFYCVNHAECNFPRPDDYLPERWVQPTENDEERWEPRTAENDRGGAVPLGKELLTFSAGARSCVGRPLALRLVTTLLAVVVRSFHIELADPNYKIELKRFGLNQIAKGGIPLILRRRETPSSP